MKVMLQVFGRRWTGERIGRLGLLLGLGWDTQRIADDPLIHSTANNVYRQLGRFGLSIEATKVMAQVLPDDVARYFDMAASKRAMTREALIRLVLVEIAAESSLLDNILDDGV